MLIQGSDSVGPLVLSGRDTGAGNPTLPLLATCDLGPVA